MNSLDSRNNRSTRWERRDSHSHPRDPGGNVRNWSIPDGLVPPPILSVPDRRQVELAKAVRQRLMHIDWLTDGISSLVSSNRSYIDKSTVVTTTSIAEGRPRS